MTRIPGLEWTDHTVAVPLDHGDPGGPAIDVFVREVTAAGRFTDDLPWLVYLQGGPGGAGPRPGESAWLPAATETHRVLLLDQRGTGRSTPVTAQSVRGLSGPGIAAYLRHFRADSIVADAEILRERLAGGRPWETLGQSYGGFITLTYLSRAPQGLQACYITGGLPGLTATADQVYARTYPRVEARNAAYYRRYPEDVAHVRALAGHLEENDVRLPDGDRLTARRLRLLGDAFGMSDGYETVHWLLENAWCSGRAGSGELSDAFRYRVMAETAFVDGPIYALQEFCYAGPGAPTRWAADRALADRPAFAADADPLRFTGEMMYRWMFAEIAALRPFAEAADLMAEAGDWPALYDPQVLAANEVPVAAAVYFDDMYVDAGLSLETAGAVGNTRTWVTNEYEHNGLRADPARVLTRLRDMAAGRV